MRFCLRIGFWSWNLVMIERREQQKVQDVVVKARTISIKQFIYVITLNSNQLFRLSYSVHCNGWKRFYLRWNRRRKKQTTYLHLKRKVLFRKYWLCCEDLKETMMGTLSKLKHDSGFGIRNRKEFVSLNFSLTNSFFYFEKMPLKENCIFSFSKVVFDETQTVKFFRSWNYFVSVWDILSHCIEMPWSL